MSQSQAGYVVVVVALCAFLVVAQALEVDAAPSNNGRAHRKRDWGAPRVVAITISRVSPNILSPADNQTNLAVFSYNSYYSCVACAFNSTYGNITTNATRFSNYFDCTFPSNVYQDNVLISLWLQDCGTGMVLSNSVPLYFIGSIPSIASVTPNALIATGTKMTLTLQKPFLSNIPNQAYCAISGSNAQSAVQISPTKFVCQSNAMAIGPTNMSIYWNFPSNTYYSNKYSNESFPIVVRSNRIISISPDSVCVLGGQNITLTLELTQPNSDAFCSFSPINSEGATPILMKAIASNGSYICQTAAWTMSYGLSAMVNLVVAPLNSPISNPVKLNYFRECALEASTTTVCSLGSIPVTVFGTGYPDQTSAAATSLRVASWPNNYLGFYTQVISPPVTIINSTAISFLTSSLMYKLDTYYIQVFRSYATNTTSLPLIQMKNTNSCLADVHPSTMNYNGGDLVTVRSSMYSFAPPTCYNSVCFYCVFVDPSGFTTLQAATWVSPYELTCISPPVSDLGVGSLSIQTANARTAPLRVKWTRK